MNELTISAIMEQKNNQRFQALLSEAELARRYRQRISQPKLWQWVAERRVTVGKLFEPRERKSLKPACVCK